MGKPDSIPVPESVPHNEKARREPAGTQQQPLSGSKKTKQRNHVSHNNPEG